MRLWKRQNSVAALSKSGGLVLGAPMASFGGKDTSDILLHIILLCLKNPFILSKICCFQSIAIGWFVWEGFVSLEGLLSMWWNYSSKLEHKRVESSKLGCEIRLAGIWDWLILLYSDWYHMWIGAGERKKWFPVSFKGQWVKTKSKPMVISLTKTTLHYLCCNP